MEHILEYLKNAYHPLSILLYGSYADGTNDQTSDFDCMLIVSEKNKDHDDSTIDGVRLDCFLYTEAEAQNKPLDTFLPVYHSKIITDNGIGADLKRRVCEYIEANTATPDGEKEFLTSWIRKTIQRIAKNDDDGNMRAVSLLAESLADYCQLRDMFYFGSKKTIRYLKENDARGDALFHDALTRRSNDAIIKWAEYIIKKD